MRAITSSRFSLLSKPSSTVALRSIVSSSSPLRNLSTPISRIAKQPSAAFSTSSPAGFKASPANMVVNAVNNRAEYNKAVGTSEASASAADKKSLVVVDCFATWCGPCKAIAPKMEEYSNKYTDVGFYKVDVDDVPDVAQELGVRAMPTFVFFKNGQKVDEVLGAAPPSIEAAIEKHMG